MSKQYAVIGLGKFGFSVATTLAQAGKEVLAVDKDAEPVQEIADLVTYAARADITDSRVFASLGISNMDVVIVGISENMESSILATLQAKEAGVPLVIAKCMSQMHANILKKVGADRVVMAESETGYPPRKKPDFRRLPGLLHAVGFVLHGRASRAGSVDGA